jgi:hypothetical protein
MRNAGLSASGAYQQIAIFINFGVQKTAPLYFCTPDKIFDLLIICHFPKDQQSF